MLGRKVHDPVGYFGGSAPAATGTLWLPRCRDTPSRRFFLKGTLIAWSFLMLLFYGVALPSGDAMASELGTCKHVQTGVEFPNNLGGLERWSGLLTFGKEDLGGGVQYGIEGKVRATIYLYTLGLKRIPQGVESSTVREQFAHVSEDIYEMQKQGKYTHVEVLAEGLLPIPRKTGDLKALHKWFVYREKHPGIPESSPLLSCLILTGYRNHFLKIRLTTTSSQDVDPHVLLSDFLKDLGDALK